MARRIVENAPKRARVPKKAWYATFCWRHCCSSWFYSW